MRYLLIFCETDYSMTCFSNVYSNCKKTIIRLSKELSEKYYVTVWKWCGKNCASHIMKRIKEETIDDGLRIELSEITKSIN